MTIKNIKWMERQIHEELTIGYPQPIKDMIENKKTLNECRIAMGFKSVKSGDNKGGVGMYKSNLKLMREEKGLSRSELSKLSGVGVRTIEAFEQGLRDINGARIVTVLSLADALECDVYEIVNPR